MAAYSHVGSGENLRLVLVVVEKGDVEMRNEIPELGWTTRGRVSRVLDGATVEVVAPRMYTWDGASIPRPLWRIIGKPLDPRFALASLVHDWICEHAETRPQRVFGDAVFLWLLRDAGVPAWRHYAMWLAVSAWRRFVWRAKK